MFLILGKDLVPGDVGEILPTEEVQFNWFSIWRE
jgi:hypothetical protein